MWYLTWGKPRAASRTPSSSTMYINGDFRKKKKKKNPCNNNICEGERDMGFDETYSAMVRDETYSAMVRVCLDW